MLKLRVSGTALLKFACFMNLGISFLPIVDYYCPWYVTMFPVLIVLYVTLQKRKNVYPLIIVVSTIIAIGILEYWVVYRNTPVVSYFINFMITFIPCILAIQIRRNIFKREFFESYLRILVVFTGITSVTTMIGLKIYPMSSRELASGTALYDTSRYLKMNIGGYEFIYALVLLIPVFMWLIKNASKAGKVMYCIILSVNMLCIYQSQYTIALLCAILSVIVTWMQFCKKSTRMLMGVMVPFAILCFFPILGKVFYWASEVINQDYLADRLLQVAQLLSGETVSTKTTTERIEHYENQLRAFLASPIWGHNLLIFQEGRISGHSSMLDVLGGAGILGICYFVSFVKRLYERVVCRNGQKTSAYVKATWVTLTILAILNPVLFPQITTVAFMGCMCIDKVENTALQ